MARRRVWRVLTGPSTEEVLAYALDHRKGLARVYPPDVIKAQFHSVDAWKMQLQAGFGDFVGHASLGSPERTRQARDEYELLAQEKGVNAKEMEWVISYIIDNWSLLDLTQ